ncbi:MAG TPA: ABC transporter ATP-binding protein [Sedimentibacter sp.]|jgi:branched-chain amino acid transport system ATP-binding protein|nr:ABC transporter ATP-binding protein [Sedimentibacter sp.]HHZ00153.1 ABC transporter ATP-binding protein [Tissierellia bacterium]HOK48930.1 ABC transporter ATP-binding protein [Sedimentibacter sp.]HRC81272.1 ABC transporter ATP-binding protein [Sedimentibacter sp.]
MSSLLKVDKAVKRFGGITAVDGVELEVKEGQVVGLIGPNGSGKTTVLNVITGVYKPEEGKIIFNGEEIQGMAPHTIVEKGIGRTFQNIRLINSQTVFDNVWLGHHVNSKLNIFDIILKTRREKEELKQVREEIEEVLDFIGLLSIKDEYIGNIPYGQKKILEIGRALMAKPKLLLLDEPAAGLNNTESRELVQIVKKINQKGISILLIEHEMEFVQGLAERVYVLDHGKKIAEGTFAECTNNPLVIEAYLGTGRGDKNAEN